MAERWDWKDALPHACRRSRNVNLFVVVLVAGIFLPWTGPWATLCLAVGAWGVGVGLDCRNRLFVYESLGVHPEFLRVAELGEKVESRVMTLSRTVRSDSLLRMKRKVRDFTSRAERLAWTLQDVGDGSDEKRLREEVAELRRRADASDDSSTRSQYLRAALMKEKAMERATESTRHYRRAVAELTQIAASLEVVYAKLGTFGAVSHRSLQDGAELSRDLEEAVAQVEDLEDAFQEAEREGNGDRILSVGGPAIGRGPLIAEGGALALPPTVEEFGEDELFLLTFRAAVADGRLSKREKRILGELGRMLGLSKEAMKALAHRATRGARSRQDGGEGELSPSLVFEEVLRRVYADDEVSTREKELVVASARVLGLDRRSCEEIQRRVLASRAT